MRHEDLQMIDKMNFFLKTTDFSLIATTDFELDEDSNGFFLVFVIFLYSNISCCCTLPKNVQIL